MNKRLDLRKRIALELYRKFRKNRTKLHELRTLFWECTLRCNLSCLHCGSDCRVSALQPDMPVADFLRVIDEITPYVEPNKVMITFSGGEPLMRKDLEACGIELYRRGFPWGTVTNGMLLTRKRFDSLRAAGMHSMTISLDGFEEAHNWMRGHPRSFANAIAGIRLLKEEKEVAWDIVTCVNQKNFNDLERFKEFLIAEGVRDWRLFTIFPVGRAAHSPELQLDRNQFLQLMDFIRHCRREGRINASYACEGFLGNYEGEVRDNLYHCNAGVSTASILIDGSISGCLSIRSNFHQGNIYTDSFVDCWENGFQSYRDRSWAKKGQCADCSMFRYCEGNGMHLYDDNAELLFCHYRKLI